MATAKVAVSTLVAVVSIGSVSLSGFAGAWQVVEAGVIPAHIIIQDLGAYSARILYSWEDSPPERTWLSARARVLSDGKLYWGYPDAFRLTLSPDGQLLIGEQERGGWTALASYRRNAHI